VAEIGGHWEALYSLAVRPFNGSGGTKDNRDLRAGAELCALCVAGSRGRAPSYCGQGAALCRGRAAAARVGGLTRQEMGRTTVPPPRRAYTLCGACRRASSSPETEEGEAGRRRVRWSSASTGLWLWLTARGESYGFTGEDAQGQDAKEWVRAVRTC
jgi:hypothetical protein